MKQTSKRREEILSQLKSEGSVSVSQLSQSLGVSTVTIRNDLAYLETKGLLMRSYGGAIDCQVQEATPEVVQETNIQEKATLHAREKASIAKAAASHIHSGETIILDSGTTTEQVAKLLLNKQGIVVMTNGLNIAATLSEADDVEVMMTGGTLRKKSLSFYGSQAEENMKAYHFDKIFLGVDGFHIRAGITTHNENEARLNRAMCDAAKEVIVVTDSSKFDKVSLHKIIPCDLINTLITDKNIPQDYLHALSGQGIKVITV
ncbi:transcriptional repressor AgaR [Photobacterium atrarenae]|uniref:Transcriptional repressor AgaR n=1 Tax=Photobacterium atrarenae TaxID=865757 RepID=A0ABY5GM61_9GAMM|nr:transcriptional repressor AgaR [Photobacterium atrarenae]UTV29637.1 transcriptional repressor AgaR [Photobacterium atrarenae]